MSKFNVPSVGQKTENRAGGKAYTESPKLRLASLLLTSFVQDQFYRDAKTSMKEVSDLLSVVDPLFAAKAAVYARNEFGLRSITHVLAGEIPKYLSGTDWGKAFYKAVVRRPDDMLEILAYYKSNGSKTIPHAMKKGFAAAFDKFDGYQLAKYRGEAKAIKLVDVVNLVRPIPIDKNAVALKELVRGTLKSTDTWEAKLTQAGQKATSEDEKAEFKADSWKSLITERKIGYFALLRNLRNIMEQAPDMVELACDMLVEEKLIRKSLVLPFRFVSAYEEVQKMSTSKARTVMQALNKAIDLSCANVPSFDGETLVVADFSGSMGKDLTDNRGKASLFAAVLAKANNADFMIFGDRAAYININPSDSTLTITNNVMKHNLGGWGAISRNGLVEVGHGTNFHSIFDEINKRYERVVILSDMQGWVGHNTPVGKLRDYEVEYEAKPFIYSIDLAGYGTLQFPESRVIALAGFSEKIFDLMKATETDREALIKKIEAVTF